MLLTGNGNAFARWTYPDACRTYNCLWHIDLETVFPDYGTRRDDLELKVLSIDDHVLFDHIESFDRYVVTEDPYAGWRGIIDNSDWKIFEEGYLYEMVLVFHLTDGYVYAMPEGVEEEEDVIWNGRSSFATILSSYTTSNSYHDEVTARFYMDFRDPVNLEVDDSTLKDVKVDKKFDLTARLTDKNGDPIANEVISIMNNNVRTDENGYATLHDITESNSGNGSAYVEYGGSNIYQSRTVNLKYNIAPHSTEFLDGTGEQYVVIDETDALSFHIDIDRYYVYSILANGGVLEDEDLNYLKSSSYDDTDGLTTIISLSDDSLNILKEAGIGDYELTFDLDNELYDWDIVAIIHVVDELPTKPEPEEPEPEEPLIPVPDTGIYGSGDSSVGKMTVYEAAFLGAMAVAAGWVLVLIEKIILARRKAYGNQQ